MGVHIADLRERRSLRASSVAALLFLALLSAGSARAATYSVTGTADSASPCTGTVCPSLRSAISKANASAGPDEIDLAADTFRIELAGADEDANASGDLDVTSGELLIKGVPSGRTVIEGALPSGKGERDLEVLGNAQLTLEGLTVTGGRAGEQTGGAVFGGGVDAIGHSVLRLEHARVTGNRAIKTFLTPEGGGVAVLGQAALIATNSTIDANHVEGGVGEGGGISLDEEGRAELVNVTLSANGAPIGGGLFDGPGKTTVAFSTIVDNGAEEGAGIDYGNTPTVVRDSILTENGGDCAPGPISSEGGNVAGPTCKATQTGDLTTEQPKLKFEGATIPFFVPETGSPALDRAVGACPATDARGVTRPQGPACDSGAIEIPVASAPAPPPAGGSGTLLMHAPVISAATQNNSRWRLGRRQATIAARPAPVGTVFTIALDQPAAISFSFAQKLSGRKVKGHCVAPSRANSHRPRCTRSAPRGTLTFNAHAGSNRVSFQGRVSSTRTLRPGSYVVRITATSSTGHSATRTLAFTIVR